MLKPISVSFWDTLNALRYTTCITLKPIWLKSQYIKFDDKEPDSKMLELVHNFSEICVFEDTWGARGPEIGSSEANDPSKVGCSEAIRTSEVGDLKVDLIS